MNGNFSQGGWPGLLSFTTVPTNNPYGAFAYAQVGLWRLGVQDVKGSVNYFRIVRNG